MDMSRPAFALVALALAVPATATAQVVVEPAHVLTLAYETGAYTGKPVLWAANLDGSNRHVLAKGGQWPQVSPQGGNVAYTTGSNKQTLRVTSSLGGTPKTI